MNLKEKAINVLFFSSLTNEETEILIHYILFLEKRIERALDYIEVNVDDDIDKIHLFDILEGVSNV